MVCDTRVCKPSNQQPQETWSQLVMSLEQLAEWASDSGAITYSLEIDVLKMIRDITEELGDIIKNW